MINAENKTNSRIEAVEVEFEDVTVTSRSSGGGHSESRKAVFSETNKISASLGVPITSASELVAGEHKESYSYEFDSNILLNCKVEKWGRGVSIFADFLKDAKKYYKKTCLNAKYVYFFSYRPTYREMSHEQLCWYLHWRSAVRDGNYIKTGLTYIFLYLYEEINLSDIIGAEKVYNNIINIWKNYRKEFPRLDKYIAEWLIDFALIHRIKINLSEIEDILPNLLNSVTFPEIYIQEGHFKKESYVAEAINNISAYDYKKSKFYKPNEEMFDMHIKKLVHSVLSSSLFEEIFNSDLKNSVKMKATRESYAGAICTYENKWKITVEYRSAYKNFFFRQCITDMIRLAENILREHLGIKSRLPLTDFPDKLKPLIEEYQRDYLPPKSKENVSSKSKKISKRKESRDEAAQAVEFAASIESASEIEKQSWSTTATLVELQQRDGEEGNRSDGKIEEPKATIQSLALQAPPSISMVAIDTDDASFENHSNISDICVDIENLETTDEESEESEVKGFVGSLSDMEYTVISALTENLDNASFDNLCAKFLNEHGIMLESVIDEINNKSMDFIGDIIFDLALGEVVDEYKDDLLTFLLKKKKSKTK